MSNLQSQPTDALTHLLNMLYGGNQQSAGTSAPVDEFGIPGGAAYSNASQIPAAGAAKTSHPSGVAGLAPFINPEFWMQQGGATGFMPMSGYGTGAGGTSGSGKGASVGGMGGSSAGKGGGVGG